MEPPVRKAYLSQAAGTRAFTLIELLVVITVITVMISILLPSLGQARSSSTRVKCSANLKQIGVLAAVYQSDHKFFAMPGNVSTAGNSVAWQHFLNVEYANTGTGMFLCPSIQVSQGDKTGHFIPACNSTASPFDKVEYTSLVRASYTMNVIVPHTANTWTGGSSTWSGASILQAAGYNAKIIRGWTGAPAGASSGAKDIPIHTSQLDRPSSSIYIVDHRPDYFDGVTNNSGNMTSAFLDGIYQFPTTDWGTNVGTNSAAGTPRMKVGYKVHNDAFNALMGDGHVIVVQSTNKSDQEAWIASSK
jgi:prepilin-type N-terminal cleavage/methylation domain-containing protein/prepilin-type processing-associated H-X9-DG protein